jgi:hypothetical protein
MDFHGFLTHFSDLVERWTAWFMRSYPLPRLRIERTNCLLQRGTTMMNAHREFLVS